MCETAQDRAGEPIVLSADTPLVVGRQLAAHSPKPVLPALSFSPPGSCILTDADSIPTRGGLS